MAVLYFGEFNQDLVMELWSWPSTVSLTQISACLSLLVFKTFPTCGMSGGDRFIAFLKSSWCSFETKTKQNQPLYSICKSLQKHNCFNKSAKKKKKRFLKGSLQSLGFFPNRETLCKGLKGWKSCKGSILNIFSPQERIWGRVYSHLSWRSIHCFSRKTFLL